MKLSLAIINDNEALYLKKFFESLGSWKDSLDIVFVDNHSSDNSIQIAKDLGIEKIIAFEKKEVSRPVLYNAAASRTEGEYILFTHSDIIFGDGFFENLDKSLKERTGLDFMNFRVMYVDKTTSAPSIVYWDFEGKRIKLSYHSIWGISDPALKKLVSCSESCFLVDSTVFKYEHFDERYFETFFIEDLLLKLEFQGANIVYDEDFYIEHYFLEEHERLKTLKHDSQLFIKNNPVVKLVAKDRQISSLEASLQEKDEQIQRLESQIHSLESQIQQIQRSIPMRLANRYQRVVEKLLRPGTRRRYYYELMFTGIRVILNEGRRSFFRKVRIWLQLRRATVKKRFLAPKFNASISRKEAEKLAFPIPSEKPDVSIIIPVYNKWKYTLNCLKSICENTDGDYEIVVIDDASTDATAEVLSNVKNLNLVTNEQNMGFVESCNRGARASKGENILFLNNDTMVTKDWLPPLLEVIKREDVGAVGSKLVYPDGTLQEAGAIIWNDGTAFNYGRGDDESKPEYNFVREVDYCTGACLLVKRELFEKVGGFDERFKPAYCEESDFCLSLRSLGYKVMYQPMSVVVHFERVTTGDSIKKYQETNIRKLREKWRAVLQKKHYSPDIGNLFLARDRRRGQRILVIDYSVPTYDKDAGSLNTYSYIKLFSEMGFRITFIPYNGLELMPYTLELQQMGIEVLYGHFDFDQWLKECGRYIDLAWLTRPEISVQCVDRVRRTSPARIIYYTQDLHYLREQRRYEVEGDEGASKQATRLKELEFNIFGKADVVLTPSIAEKEIISQEFPSKRVEVIPAYIFFENLADKVPPFNSRKDLLYLGGFNHTPSIDTAIFLVNEIFPLIRQKLPGTRLYIVGSNPPPQLLALKSRDVIVTGYVKDLAPYFERCRLFLAPIRYGAGVKGKIVISMSYGLPVVTTSIGAEGIRLIDGENALISDDPQGFAEKATLLYNDENLWNRLSTKSIETVRRDFSYELARDKIKGLVSTVDQPQAKRPAYDIQSPYPY